MIARWRRQPAEPLPPGAFDLLSLTVAAVLAVHMPHLPWWLGLSLAGLLGLHWWRQRQRGLAMPQPVKIALVLVLTLAVLFEYRTPFGREPGSALAVGLLVLKVLEARRARDARVTVAFSCFALMAALLFDQGLLATLVVGLALLPALATLRALQPGQAGRSLPRSLLNPLKLLLAVVPVALLAFVLVPRLSSPLWGAPQAQARTGLDDRMSPGQLNDLLLDDSPALRVSFDGAPPAPDLRYFRAYVMWDYDGATWTTVRVQQPPEPLQAGATLAYRVSLEPGEHRVLPTLDVAVAAPVDAHLSAARSVLPDQRIDGAYRYAARSAVHHRLGATALPDAVRRLALALPAGFDPRAHALARRWRDRYGNDDGAIVQAALGLFHDGGFRYTLAPAPLGHNAVDDFLFGTREGFCEHYASAFTVLMRAAGIPARVVTGYQGGYWNTLGQYLLVRQSDAHAWSEVWFAGRGWVRVDPTAAVRPERVELGASAAAADQLGWARRGWLWSARNRWDVVNRWWNQAVVGFDALRQSGLLSPFGVRDASAGLLGGLLAGLVGLCALGGIGWALWRRERIDPLRRALRRLEAALARCGIRRGRGEGPRDFLQRAADALPAQRAEIERLMRAYLELRYATDRPAPESTGRFVRMAREFRPRPVVK